LHSDRGGNLILDDIANLFCELNIHYPAKEISRHFDKERKWVYLARCGKSYVLNAEFIAGLNHYGYELKLVKKEKTSGRIKNKQ
jgi:hypothetical protein